MNKFTIEERLRHVISIHFHPDSGTPYWLDIAKTKNLNPRHDVASIDDLVEFGPMDENALSSRPIEDFVPRKFHSEKEQWILGETGGTTGNPKTTVFRKQEFYQAFILPFLIACQFRKFPRNLNWLWIGPSGPHIIGKAARECARVMGSPDPFSVDCDPRWIKKFDPGSIAFGRYFHHIIEQAYQIIDTQNIGILFSTPKILVKLTDSMSDLQRSRIRGVHFGGMELGNKEYRKIHNSFPHAVFISGYGNSLCGMCPEFSGSPNGPLDYFPVGNRIIFQVIPDDSTPLEPNWGKVSAKVGDSGRLIFSRLDECFLIINQLERDYCQLISPPQLTDIKEYLGIGIRNPGPSPEKAREISKSMGIY